MCIGAIPTDGLGVSNSDLDQLGASTYAEVDKILKTWLAEDYDCFYWDDYLKYPGRIENPDEFFKYRESLKDHPVIQNPVNIQRDQIFKFPQE